MSTIVGRLSLVILAVLPFERIPSWAIDRPVHATIRISQILGLILITTSLTYVWKQRRILAQPYWLALALFNMVCILSFSLAPDKLRSGSVVIYTLFVSVLAVVISVRLKLANEKYVITALLIGGGLACAFGYYQFFGDLAGLPTSLTGLRPQYSQPVFGFPRIQSTGLEPLYFGNFLLIPASLLFYGFIIRKWSLWVALPTLLLVIEVWLTLSRGAILALCLEALLFLIVSVPAKSIRRGICIVVLTGLGSLGATGLISYGTHHAVKKNFQSTHAVSNFSKQATNFSTGESAIGRGETRDLAIRAWHEHPLVGIGPGEFGYYAHLHNPERYEDNHTIVNNEPFELLAETGILGLLSFGSFVTLLLYTVVKSRLFSPEGYKSLRLPLLIGLMGILFQYLSFSTLYITHLWIIFGLLAATTYKKSATE